MKVRKKYFVGKNKPGIWSSVYAYKPTNEKLFERRGEVFAAVVIEGPAEFDSSIAGNLILDLFHESYFESKNKSTLGALEEAVRAAKNRLLKLVENDESAALSGINFDLVALSIKKNYFFSVRVGEASLKIFRNGSLTDVSAAFKDPTGEGNFKVLSGLTQKYDVFMLSTPEVEDTYLDDDLLSAVDEFNEIGIKNKMVEDDSKLAMIMVGLDVTDKPSTMGELAAQRQAKEELEEDDENIGYDEDDVAGQEGGMEEELDAVPYSARKFNFNKFKENLGARLSTLKAGAASKYSEFKARRAAGRPLGAKPPMEIPAEGDNFEAAPQQVPLTGQESTAMLYFKKAKFYATIYGTKAFEFIKKDVLALDNDNVYVGRGGRRVNYRVVIAVVVLLVIVLFIGIRFTQNAASNRRIKEDNEALLNEIDEGLNNIRTSSALTINAPDNIDAREDVLEQINTLQEQIENSEVAEEYQARIDEKRTELASLKSKLFRTIEVNDPQVITDLGANFEGADPADFDIAGGKLYVVDRGRNVIYEVNTSGGEREILTRDLQSPYLIATDPKEGVVVLDKSGTALGLFDIETGSLNRFLGMTSAKLSSAVEMDAYEVASNDIRLYFASSASPQVQQINKRGDSYSDGPKSRWQNGELDGITDIQLLDGKFLMIKPGEGVVRYFSNAKITTTVSGLIGGDSLGTANRLATDGNYVYVADPVNKRIVVLTKSRGNNVEFMDMVAQYKYTGDSNAFGNIKEITVDGTNIYVLDGAKVYKLPKSSLTEFAFQ